MIVTQHNRNITFRTHRGSQYMKTTEMVVLCRSQLCMKIVLVYFSKDMDTTPSMDVTLGMDLSKEEEFFKCECYVSIQCRSRTPGNSSISKAVLLQPHQVDANQHKKCITQFVCLWVILVKMEVYLLIMSPPPPPRGGGHLDLLWFPVTQMCVGICAILCLRNISQFFAILQFFAYSQIW